MTPVVPRRLLSGVLLLPAACAAPGEPPPVERPADVPALHHVGLNSVDPAAALAWYLAVWPEADATEMDGKPAVAAEMYLVINPVDDPPGGAFDPELGRPAEQSAFWHIGAFVNTTEDRERMAALGIDHLPLFTGPSGDAVWRSGLTPYAGIVTGDDVDSVESAEPRPGGFSYLLAPDGVLFERTGGVRTTPAMSHVHFFHEEPMCAANWYVDHLGMSLPPVENDDGTTSPRAPHEPCSAERGPAGWPSLERAGTIRQPRAGVVHGNGSMSWYPRQCVDGRCGEDQRLVPSRGQALDHVAFSVESVDAWYAWLSSAGVSVIEEPRAFDDGRSFMIEGPDRLAIEFVEHGAGAP